MAMSKKLRALARLEGTLADVLDKHANDVTPSDLRWFAGVVNQQADELEQRNRPDLADELETSFGGTD